MHFSEIIKLQFGKQRQTLLCILLLFRIISKKCLVPPCLDLLSLHSHKPHKNTSLLVDAIEVQQSVYFSGDSKQI